MVSKIGTLWAGAVALALGLAVAACGERARAPVPDPAAPDLITRAALFGEPARGAGQLSPRGDRIAFLAPRDGVTNIWVLSVDAMDEARPLTDERARGVTNFRWSADGATLLFLQDNSGDENARLYGVDATTGVVRPLTPAGVRAEILGVSQSDPDAVIVSLNDRDRGWPDVVRIELATGARSVLLRNAGPRGYVSVLLDRDNAVRVGMRALADGGVEVVAMPPRGRARTLFAASFEDAMSMRLIGMEADGAHFLMLDSSVGQPDAARDRTALVRVDIATGERIVLGEGERSEVVDVWIDPATGAAEAFATEYLRREWRALNSDSQADIEFLDRSLTGDFSVVSRSADDTRWIVLEESPTTPRRSYLFDRAGPAGRRLTSLFSHRPDLQQAALQPMTPVEIVARDGVSLVSYLTLPGGADANGDARPEQPLPLVLLPHDGPWARDSYGFDAMHQWLANRGYAVLSVNYRGSAGFGKAFLNAGNGEWGAAIQNDLADAAQWAVAQRVAEEGRVAIVGSGFGGYAVLSGLAFTPDQYRCGASFAAPANLFSMLDLAPAWQRDQLYRRVADARTEAGRQLLRVRSPVFHAGRVRSPLLLAYGARDPRLSRGETDQVAQAVRLRGMLTYLVFPDEGRELIRPQDRLSYLAVLEHFLGDCLGGRVEPVGAAFEGAAINVYDGAVNVPGLSAFSRRPAQAAPQPAPQETGEDGAENAIEPGAEDELD
ncbi:MAG: S9 family peptidase [Hyphomonadaceae bacterium]|nr:S9 family peptidase [Hyphomonadaceae bacterium]